MGLNLESQRLILIRKLAYPHCTGPWIMKLGKLEVWYIIVTGNAKLHWRDSVVVVFFGIPFWGNFYSLLPCREALAQPLWNIVWKGLFLDPVRSKSTILGVDNRSDCSHRRWAVSNKDPPEEAEHSLSIILIASPYQQERDTLQKNDECTLCTYL